MELLYDVWSLDEQAVVRLLVVPARGQRVGGQRQVQVVEGVGRRPRHLVLRQLFAGQVGDDRYPGRCHATTGHAAADA